MCAKAQEIGKIGVPPGELPDRQHPLSVGETRTQVGGYYRRIEFLTRAWSYGLKGIEYQSF